MLVVVDDEQLPTVVRLRAHRLDRARQHVRPVPGRHHDGDERPRRDVRERDELRRLPDRELGLEAGPDHSELVAGRFELGQRGVDRRVARPQCLEVVRVAHGPSVAHDPQIGCDGTGAGRRLDGPG